ncbi:GDSL-type esterase/lipase family protein, partial [Kineococcus glutinatus]|uniref:GDSL-type esterase/lipase family protein n=1 Tax=Kineococcus glutinatus TaxID=1070872 RepID=UPI0031E7FEB1
MARSHHLVRPALALPALALAASGLAAPSAAGAQPATAPSSTAPSATAPATTPGASEVLRLDAGPGALAEGYRRLDAATAHSPATGLGWADPSKVTGVDRGTADPLRSDFTRVAGTELRLDLPNADYRVGLVAGDATGATDVRVVAETIEKVPATRRAAGQFLETSFDIALVDGQLTLEFGGTAANLAAVVVTRLPARERGEELTAYLASDSTVMTYGESTAPQAGWGQALPRYLSEDVRVDNRAIGGRSSRSFIAEGRLDEILLAIRPGDHLLVQFAHNDSTPQRPARYATPEQFEEFLRTYVEGARQRGAVPVLVTPMGRRVYEPTTGKFEPSFPEYVAKMQELAAELDVPLVDLSARSVAWYDEIGPEGTLSAFLYVPPGVYPAHPQGLEDQTHFQGYGATQLARMVGEGLAELDVPLAREVRTPPPPAAVPAAPRDVRVGGVSAGGAVLQWEASAGADLYRVYRRESGQRSGAFRLVSTTTVPVVHLGGMREATRYDVRVVAANDRGESRAATVHLSTPAALHRFDLGPAGATVPAGWTGIDPGTAYTAERGFGLTPGSAPTAGDRPEVGDPVQRDFLASPGAAYGFSVDVPDGVYAVRTWHGDFTEVSRTSVTVEGVARGTSVAQKRTVNEKIVNDVRVTDGRLDLSFAGDSAHVNGVEITAVLPTPAAPELRTVRWRGDTATASLQWLPVPGAVAYQVHRTTAGGAPELVAQTRGTRSADEGLRPGSHAYTVTAVDGRGVTSLVSAPLDVVVAAPA